MAGRMTEASDLERLIETVAEWPTSFEAKDGCPDMIDDWILMARKIRARDRRQALRIVAGRAAVAREEG